MSAESSFNRIKDFLAGYFTLSGHLVPQDEAEASIREGVSFRGTTMLILIFAIFVASLGLNTNSTAVIIGAMLISPLMGPIIGVGLGVGIQLHAHKAVGTQSGYGCHIQRHSLDPLLPHIAG